MKIYTKVTFDIATGTIIEEESFDYRGPVALCKGGSGVPAPLPPTKEEIDLVMLQTADLRFKLDLEKSMVPIALKEMGYQYKDTEAIAKAEGLSRQIKQLQSEYESLGTSMGSKSAIISEIGSINAQLQNDDEFVRPNPNLQTRLAELKGQLTAPIYSQDEIDRQSGLKTQMSNLKSQLDTINTSGAFDLEQIEGYAELDKLELETAKQNFEITKKSLELTGLNIESAKTLLPLQQKMAEQGIELTSFQIESARALAPLQETLARQGIDLNTLQINAMMSEVERNAALEPLLLDAMGYAKDESGKYAPVPGTTDPILANLEGRYTSALEGKEPLSPAMEAELKTEEDKLRADLSRRLGPGWESSTPGIQSMDKFKQRAELVREEARQATISQAGSQYFQARGLVAGEKQQKISNIAGLMGSGTSLSNVPTGVSVSGGGSGLTMPNVSTGGNGTNTGGGMNMSGLLGGGTSSSISDLRSFYSGERAKQEQYASNVFGYQSGQQAGQSTAMLSGAASGATVGTTILPGVGTAIGAGVGLLAGYLLS